MCIPLHPHSSNRTTCHQRVLFVVSIICMFIYLLVYKSIDDQVNHYYGSRLMSSWSSYVQHNKFGSASINGSDPSNPSFTVAPWAEISWLAQLKNLFKTGEKSVAVARKLFPPSSDWQTIWFGKSKFFIYSAFTQHANTFSAQNESHQYSSTQDDPTLVTILSSPTFFLEGFRQRNFTVRCVFRWKSKSSPETPSYPVMFTEVTAVERMGFWNKRVAGMLFRCPLPRYTPTEEVPFWVSLVIMRLHPRKKILNTAGRDGKNLIPIHYYKGTNIGAPWTSADNQHRHTISACVLPIYDFNKVFPFLEWLEYYKMMGVEQFTFYNLSIGPRTSCLLENARDYYKGQISLQVLPWHNFPLKAHIDVREGPSLPEAAFDCLYRHKNGESQFITLIDLDEYITPATGFDQDIGNFTEMIAKINRGHNITQKDSGRIGAYMFRNAFYNFNFVKDKDLGGKCARWTTGMLDPVYQSVCRNAMTLQHNKRNYIFEHAHRSKYFVRPEAAVAVGNHEVGIREDVGYTKLFVNDTEAILRHYRFWNVGKGILKDIHVHPFSEKFAPKLVMRLGDAVKHFTAVCNLTMEQVLK